MSRLVILMRHFVRASTALLMLLSLLACSEQKLSPLSPNATILAFGDSLTVGVGSTPQHSYPSVLAEISGRRVVNAGVSGEETTQGVVRLRELIAKTAPDLLILLEGGNDILRNRQSASIKQNLAMMIETAQHAGVEVVLIGVPAKSLFSDTAPLYRELAEQYQLVLEDELIADLLRDSSLKSDSIHLNSKGYRLMAESIYELLIDNGAF